MCACVGLSSLFVVVYVPVTMPIDHLSGRNRSCSLPAGAKQEAGTKEAHMRDDESFGLAGRMCYSGTAARWGIFL